MTIISTIAYTLLGYTTLMHNLNATQWSYVFLVLTRRNEQCKRYWQQTINNPHMGSIWGRQDPGGPHVGPINFAIWELLSARNLTSSTAVNQVEHRYNLAVTYYTPYFRQLYWVILIKFTVLWCTVYWYVFYQFCTSWIICWQMVQESFNCQAW